MLIVNSKSHLVFPIFNEMFLSSNVVIIEGLVHNNFRKCFFENVFNRESFTCSCVLSLFLFQITGIAVHNLHVDIFLTFSLHTHIILYLCLRIEYWYSFGCEFQKTILKIPTSAKKGTQSPLRHFNFR